MRSDQSNSPPEPDSTRSPLWIVILGHLRFPALIYENLNTLLSFKNPKSVFSNMPSSLASHPSPKTHVKFNYETLCFKDPKVSSVQY